MPMIDVRPTGGALMPAPEPRRRLNQVGKADYYEIGPGIGGLGYPDQGTADTPSGPVGTWATRYNQWQQAFKTKPGGKLKYYWSLWRNFDQGPSAGPGQEWRDRTVVPWPFKWIRTRVPRLIMGSFGDPDNFTVLGRGFKDEQYESAVRSLIEESRDEIGKNDPQGETFLKRIIDGLTYCQIVGHVWFKAFWRKETAWLKTKVPSEVGEDGKPKKWTPVEILETLYDNVDVTWVPITHLAVDVFGKRRWAIERIITSLESLKAENERHKKENGMPLYENLEAMELDALTATSKPHPDEPRDGERWPLSDSGINQDPAETPVELWLCWDNVDRTLTKVANRKYILARGQSPTPDGLDPYIGVPAVPIPGRTYGDSTLNWTGPLAIRGTRISRARMDENMMGMFQQYLYREGAIKTTQWFFRPGGGMPIEQANPDRPVSDSIYLVPRRPVPPEAFTEEAYVERQGETAIGADITMQGVEATNKSRDVTAAEINQRAVQGGSAYQLEVLYLVVTLVIPLYQKWFDLLRQNLTTERQVRILDDNGEEVSKSMTLADLDRPIDIQISSPLLSATQGEKLQELQAITALAKNDNMLAPRLNWEEIALELFRNTRTLKRNPKRFVKTEAQLAREQQAMASAAGAAPSPNLPATAPVPPGAEESAGGPGATGLTGASGVGPLAVASGPGGMVEEI